MTYAHAEDPKVRGKFDQMYRIWIEEMRTARGQQDRERDNMGFYASIGIMQQPFSIVTPSPAYPFPLS
jgi:hypothetical protein